MLLRTQSWNFKNFRNNLKGLILKLLKVFAQLDQDEEAKLIADGKVNEVIQKRTEKMREEHEKLLKAEKNVLIKPKLMHKSSSNQ